MTMNSEMPRLSVLVAKMANKQPILATELIQKITDNNSKIIIINYADFS